MESTSDRSVLWLRGEGAAVLVTSAVLYAHYGRGWLFFALLLLAPDLSMVGYLRGARAGAFAYNLFHSYMGPLLLGSAAVVAEGSLLASLALVWSAHIGLDRALGYGLKLPTGFSETHLGRLGRRTPVPAGDVSAAASGTATHGR